MTIVFLKFQLKNTQIRNFLSQIQAFLFFREILQLEKFEGADFKYENSFFRNSSPKILTFSHNFQFLLGLLYFAREIFDIMYEGLLHGYYSLPFKFSEKVLTVTLILLFFSFILHMSTRVFLSCANNHLNLRTPQGRNGVS